MVTHVKPITQVYQTGKDVSKGEVRQFETEQDTAINNEVARATAAEAGLRTDVDENTSAIASLASPADFASGGPVIVATTANLDLVGVETVDGVLLTAGQRVLVKDQTDKTQNGIRTVAVGAWPRAADADTAEELGGLLVLVEQGATQAGKIYLCAKPEDEIVIGTTDIVFTVVSAAQIGLHSITESMLATPRFCENRAALKTLFGAGIEVPDDFLVMVGGMYTAGDGLGGLFQYQAAVSGDHDPDGRAIVTDDEGRDFICIRPDPFRLLPVDPGGCADFFGDSIPAGSGASGASTRLANRFAAKVGQTVKNYAVGGKGTWYTTYEAFRNFPGYGPSRGSSIHWLAGHNDLYTGDAANLKTPGKMACELMAFVAAAWAESCLPFSDASFTKTPSWGAGDTSLFDKSSTAFNPARILTGAAGYAVTGAVTGENIVIGAFNGPDLGGLDITIGGVNVIYDCAEFFDGGAIDGGVDATHAAILIDGIGGGSNALDIEAIPAITGSNDHMYLDYLTVLKSPAQCESIFVYLPPRPTTYSGGGSTLSTEESWNLGDMALIALVRRLQARGFPIEVIPTNDFLDPANITADVEHPNDLGHEDIAQAGASRVGPSGTQGFGNYVPELVYWTVSAGSLSVDGRVSRSGNEAKFWAKITKTGGGTYSTTIGTSFLKVPSIYPMGFPGNFIISNASNGAAIATGLINTDGKIWVPTMTTQNGQLIVSGSYPIGDSEPWAQGV